MSVMNANEALIKREKYVVYISPTRHAEGTLYLNAVLENPGFI